MIRNAESKDKEEASKLSFNAGQEIFNYFFAGKESDKGKMFEIIQLLYSKPKTSFSKENFRLYEENGKIMGGISFFPGSEYEELNKNIGKYGKEMMKVVGFIKCIKMIFRSSLGKQMQKINDMSIKILAHFTKILLSISNQFLKH
jgi:hypothetical protein